MKVMTSALFNNTLDTFYCLWHHIWTKHTGTITEEIHYSRTTATVLWFIYSSVFLSIYLSKRGYYDPQIVLATSDIKHHYISTA